MQRGFSWACWETSDVPILTLFHLLPFLQCTMESNRSLAKYSATLWNSQPLYLDYFQPCIFNPQSWSIAQHCWTWTKANWELGHCTKECPVCMDLDRSPIPVPWPHTEKSHPLRRSNSGGGRYVPPLFLVPLLFPTTLVAGTGWGDQIAAPALSDWTQHPIQWGKQWGRSSSGAQPCLGQPQTAVVVGMGEEGMWHWAQKWRERVLGLGERGDSSLIQGLMSLATASMARFAWPGGWGAGNEGQPSLQHCLLFPHPALQTPGCTQIMEEGTIHPILPTDK